MKTAALALAAAAGVCSAAPAYRVFPIYYHGMSLPNGHVAHRDQSMPVLPNAPLPPAGTNYQVRVGRFLRITEAGEPVYAGETRGPNGESDFVYLAGRPGDVRVLASWSGRTLPDRDGRPVEVTRVRAEVSPGGTVAISGQVGDEGRLWVGPLSGPFEPLPPIEGLGDPPKLEVFRVTDGGSVLAWASPSPHEALVVADAGGGHVVYRPGEPGPLGHPFTAFTNSWILDDGSVGFESFLSTDYRQSVTYRETAAGIEAALGLTFAGEQVFEFGGRASVARDGCLGITGSLREPEPWAAPVMTAAWSVPPDGPPILIAREGDPIPGTNRTIRFFFDSNWHGNRQSGVVAMGNGEGVLLSGGPWLCTLLAYGPDSIRTLLAPGMPVSPDEPHLISEGVWGAQTHPSGLVLTYELHRDPVTNAWSLDYRLFDLRTDSSVLVLRDGDLILSPDGLFKQADPLTLDVANEAGGGIAGRISADGRLVLETDWGLAYAEPTNGCAQDVDGDGVVDVRDLLDFLNRFRLHERYSDWDGDRRTTVHDLLGFLGDFRAGCPDR